MTVQARALAALSDTHDECRKLLERLVLVNSHSDNSAGVNAVGNLLVQALADLPLDLSITTGASGVRHLCFSTALADVAPPLLLIGHHDTVFPPGEFEGLVVEGDQLRGPGALDMKGGLALIVQVLRALHRAALLELMPLRFVSVGDEEIGSPESRTLLEELAQGARGALVFEAGRAGDAIITARRGSGSAQVVVHGKAAHAGNALSEGRSAIWTLARLIDRVQTLNGAIPGASASVGLVRGGTARNTVPDKALAEIDLRFSDAAGQARLLEALREAARAVEQTNEGTQVELTIQIARKPWARTDASAALLERYARAAREAGLEASEAKPMGGGSDANTVGAVGLPAIDGLGPRGAGFHTRAEYVELSSLPRKAEALLRFLLSEFRQ